MVLRLTTKFENKDVPDKRYLSFEIFFLYILYVGIFFEFLINYSYFKVRVRSFSSDKKRTINDGVRKDQSVIVASVGVYLSES